VTEISREVLAQFGSGLVFVLGLWRGWWVMGRQYTDVRRDRDRWRALYLKAHGDENAIGAEPSSEQ
jgi:hypothetical protein